MAGAQCPGPRACVRVASPQPIAPAVPTAVAFDAVTWDTDGMYDTAADATRVTARTPGVYLITATLEWPRDPLGRRSATLSVCGTTAIARDARLAMKRTTTAHTISTQRQMAVGDYVQLVAEQSSGRPLTLGEGAEVGTTLAMSWIAEGP